jgi:hypothetical protein
MSFFASGKNGQFWYGGQNNFFPGFLYKKTGGAGSRRNPSFGLICNQPTTLNNTYIPGSGVGSSSIATRRAKLRQSTSAKYNIEEPIPLYLTLEQANEIYVRFPEAQFDIQLQNAIIDGNLIQNDELTINSNAQDRILVTDANKNVVSSGISSNVFSFLQGLTGNIQDQLDEKPIVYWNNTGEQIIDPVILVGTTQSDGSGANNNYTLVSLDTPINRDRRVELIIPINSNLTDRALVYSAESTTAGRTDSQLAFQCRTYSNTFPLLDDITCIYIVIGESLQ